MVEKLSIIYKDIHKSSKRQYENLVFKQNMTNIAWCEHNPKGAIECYFYDLWVSNKYVFGY
jgi:hypothetical protein